MNTARDNFEIWSCMATLVVTEPRVRSAARTLLTAELAAVEAACSRFRADSELAGVIRTPDRTVEISAILSDLIGAALRIDRATGGLVDPTVAAAVIDLGYDRDILALDLWSGAAAAACPAPGTAGVEHDPQARTLRVPAGVGLDLGATAKPLAADRAVQRISAALGCGVLVSIGGDVAVAGDPPPTGWTIAVGEDHRTAEAAAEQVVSIRTGGLATSSTTVRRWPTRFGERHHIVDPRTGENPEPLWRTVSAAAGSSLDANAAATAAIVLGPDAPQWLSDRDISARLVGVDGAVRRVAGWPTELAEVA